MFTLSPWQSGQVAVIAAKAVFEDDEFDYWMDENGEHINYRPNLTHRGAFKLAFAFAKLNSGELIVEVMIKDDVERVRAASKTGNSDYSPWSQWYDRMAVKSALHRLARRLPSASELMNLIESGDEFDYGRQKEKPMAQPSGNRTLDAMREQRPVIEDEPQPDPQQVMDAGEQIDHSNAYADHCAAIEVADTIESLKKTFAVAWRWAGSTGVESIMKGIKEIYDARNNLLSK